MKGRFITAKKIAEFKEKDPHGFAMTILGMGIVLSGLLILSILFTLFGNIIYLNFSQSQWNEGSFMALVMLVLIAISMFATRKFRGDGERKVGAW